MQTDEKLLIEPYEDEQGNSPFGDFLLTLPDKDIDFIAKKLINFQEYRISQLKNRSDFLDVIEGTDIELFELKFKRSPQYRAVCIVRGNKIIILEMFKGSGSNGRVLKYIGKARERADDWDKRFQR
ncbi:MAG: hypothetical protein A3G49_01285 [Candidatus Sungbacteria bacterium RIFCSPLOWO2_12_FULL_41_11]|uniref:Uncharacterized protein n=1 Tax=Candidatus Sungbacteria bacterium RIFCSPLOWO2_12_FULL_41_11 TaxID=1802286 RepID=A0A1G2LNS4_9BACT|nr:MAG: hypothetical protein UV01_C0006G0014 [Parcubacteria group bacterium GW2011_GWA2_42_14]OGZ97389.1 MAG: hypothetical protein A3D41_05470 [Candidatus Sungbacteria bacterium RIFCSPHIGHO2_02_FULL_41_12b]OHA13267.1 MAG: hypothetical protein A3G49_01285 [Candidatus Sungbacteria bacterium RIFCSPLOWO2_12_FULL_41_11]